MQISHIKILFYEENCRIYRKKWINNFNQKNVNFPPKIKKTTNITEIVKRLQKKVLIFTENGNFYVKIICKTKQSQVSMRL